MQQLPVDTGVQGYNQALGSLARAKSLWGLLVVVALLVHLAGFVLVEFLGAGAAQPPVEPATAASRPVEPADAGAEADATLLAHVATVIGEALGITRLIAPLAAALLAIVTLLAVLVALSGRLDGIAPLVGAFFWSAVLALLLVPWESLAPSTGALGALGATGLAALGEARPPSSGEALGAPRLLFYARYAGYPLLAVLMWVVVGVRFAAGRRRAAGDAVAVERHES